MLVLVLLDTWMPREKVPPGILHVGHHRARATWGVRSHPASRGCVAAVQHVGGGGDAGQGVVDTWLPRENVPPGILHVSHHCCYLRRKV